VSGVAKNVKKVFDKARVIAGLKKPEVRKAKDAPTVRNLSGEDVDTVNAAMGVIDSEAARRRRRATSAPPATVLGGGREAL
jgi:hypothetical protein